MQFAELPGSLPAFLGGFLAPCKGLSDSLEGAGAAAGSPAAGRAGSLHRQAVASPSLGGEAFLISWKGQQWQTGACQGSLLLRCPATPAGGVGKFEGEGGFSGTLPPLQGQFVMQLASTAAKVVKETTSKLEFRAHLGQKGPSDSHSEHMHLQFCRTRGL